MHLNPLADFLRDLKLAPKHEPSLPAPRATPAPERNKVVDNPVRRPVNKQAALAIAPVNSWLSKPLPPEKLPDPESAEVARLKAELKIERNDHAATNDALGESRNHVRELRLLVTSLQAQIAELKASAQEKDSIIAQLEDLRL